MPSRFKIELEVELSTDSAATVIDLARKNYVEEGAAIGLGRMGEGAIPAQEFIVGVEQALMELIELIERNPLLAKANVEVERDPASPMWGLPVRRSRPRSRSKTATQKSIKMISKQVYISAAGQMVSFPC